MPRARSSSPSAAATRRGHHHIPRSGRPRTHRTQRGRRLSGNGPNESWSTPVHGDDAHRSADYHGNDRAIQHCDAEDITLLELLEQPKMQLWVKRVWADFTLQ